MIIVLTPVQRHYRKLAWASDMSYVLSLQNIYPFRDIFTIIEKHQFFYSKLNFGVTNSCYRIKWNVSACRSGKKVIARTNNYSKRDSGKGSLTSFLICLYLIFFFFLLINQSYSEGLPWLVTNCGITGMSLMRCAIMTGLYDKQHIGFTFYLLDNLTYTFLKIRFCFCLLW